MKMNWTPSFLYVPDVEGLPSISLTRACLEISLFLTRTTCIKKKEAKVFLILLSPIVVLIKKRGPLYDKIKKHRDKLIRESRPCQ